MAKLFITIIAILIACSFAIRFENSWSNRRSGSGVSRSVSYRRYYSGSGSGYGSGSGSRESTGSGDYSSYGSGYDDGYSYDARNYRLSNKYKRNSIKNADGLVFVANNDNMDSLATYLE